jgi:biopolymer transport protein ExbD
MAIHNPGSRAGHGIALKAIRDVVTHGGGKGIFATLNVVPMIDMFAILVVFLIQQFNTSGELLLINPNVAMPKASANKELERAPMIALTRGDGGKPGVLLFENEMVMSLADINEVKFPSWDIKPLAEVLKRAWKLQQTSSDKKVRGSRKVIIQADRTVPFQVIKMVMATCGRNEYREPNFAIMVGKDMEAQ